MFLRILLDQTGIIQAKLEYMSLVVSTRPINIVGKLHLTEPTGLFPCLSRTRRQGIRSTSPGVPRGGFLRPSSSSHLTSEGLSLGPRQRLGFGLRFEPTREGLARNDRTEEWKQLNLELSQAFKLLARTHLFFFRR